MLRFFFAFVLLIGFYNSSWSQSTSSSEIDELLELTNKYINSNPEKSVEILEKLEKLKNKFNPNQEEIFYYRSSISLGMRGKHKDRVALVKDYLERVRDTESRVPFLNQLADAHTILGEYDSALKAMNEAIILLPNLKSPRSKLTTIQSAITLLSSFHAYGEALSWANRMLEFENESDDSLSKCYGLHNIVEINFLMGNSDTVQNRFRSVVDACEKVDRKVIGLFVKSLAAVDLINSGRNDDGIRAGLPLLYSLTESSGSSDYLIQLEEALARAYIKRNDLPNAERFGLRAFQKAKKENLVEVLEKTSETMAAVKRAQGQLSSAIDYYEINLALKRKVLDEQLHKDLAYQRVKFDIQDKANQLTLLEQKNRLLTVEKQLQYGKNQNLVLLTTLITVLVAVLGAWLMRTWRQKNLFRYSAQMDGLTQVSNRAHFIACCNLIFKRADQQVSLVLFDMDNFKKINDTFGHASGDWVLKNVCAAIQKTLRKNDVFGRLGGEEFGLCLVDLADDEVLACAERWRAVVEEINTINSGYQFSISASFGAASRGKHGLQSFEETLAAADKALYVSKNNGRNRVSVYE